MKPVINFKVEGINFNFKVTRQFTKISDDSGVGKSFFCYALQTALNTSEDLGTHPVIDELTGNDINTIVLDGLDVSKNELIEAMLIKQSLIIIDEADFIFNTHKELSDILLKNNTSTFVLIARSYIEGLPFGYYDTARINNSDKKEIKIEYYK